MMSSDEITVQEEEDDSESYNPPSPKTPGTILVQILGPCDAAVYKWEYDVLDYDVSSSCFWITEGVGFDWWFDEYVEFTGPGFYLIEGITCEFFRGDGWTTDDDEAWEYTKVTKYETEDRARFDFQSSIVPF